MKTQMMYLDETPVVALVTLVGSFCDEQTKYFKFGTNHLAMFKALRKNGDHLKSVGAHISMTFPKNQAPKEVVDAIQEFLLPGKMSFDTLRGILNRNIEHHMYKAKYALTNPVQLAREFQRFQLGVIKHINSRAAKTGIRMALTRPKK